MKHKHKIIAGIVIMLLGGIAWSHGQHFLNLHITQDAWLATDSGRVGVGTETPDGKLHIKMPNSGYQSYDNGLMITYPDGYPMQTGIRVVFDNYAFPHRDFLRFESSGQARMVVQADGKVGIGIETPTEALHINGKILADNLKPVHHNTGNSSEKISSLPLAQSAGTALRKAIFSQRLDDLQEGELLVIMCELQVTEMNTYNVGLTTQTILGDTSVDISGSEMTEANGENITNNMHHHKRVIVGTYVVKHGDVGTKYVNVIGWAYSTAAPPGMTDWLRIDQDYGRLSVLRFKY
ncbi:MAG: hypothetical protein MJA83_06875 [Gammaproteobacteria bacterium]|nr:hypothetical protein [Gammaproteobacteria bacterium]